MTGFADRLAWRSTLGPGYAGGLRAPIKRESPVCKVGSTFYRSIGPVRLADARSWGNDDGNRTIGSMA